jgi:hypothetical protein
VDPAHLIKVVAVFVSGVVIALGSALIYVRVSDMVHQAPAAQMTIAPPEPPLAQSSDAGTDSVDQVGMTPPAVRDDQPSKPERVDHAKKQKVVIPSRHEVSKPTPRRIEPSHRRLEIAQNRPSGYPPLSSPPPDVTPTPSAAPTPAVDMAPTLDPEEQQPTPETPQTRSPSEQQSEPTQAPRRQPHVVTLAAGTGLIIRLGETLSTDHNYTGDTFRAVLEAPIVMGGFIIADKGSKVLGCIANAQRAGRVDGLSDLVLTLTEINTTDGQRVRVDTSSYDKRGPASSDRDTAEIAGGAALGALIGAVAGGGRGAAIGAGIGAAAGTGAVLATRGRPAVLPIETRLTFHLASPVTITEKLN